MKLRIICATTAGYSTESFSSLWKISSHPAFRSAGHVPAITHPSIDPARNCLTCVVAWNRTSTIHRMLSVNERLYFHGWFMLLQVLHLRQEDTASLAWTKARREVELHWRASNCKHIVQVKDVYENTYSGNKCLLVVMEWWVIILFYGRVKKNITSALYQIKFYPYWQFWLSSYSWIS